MHTRFLITKVGRIRRGSMSVRSGDHIAVGKGSSQVFILRNALHYYRLVGASYVSDLIHNQAHGDESDDSIYEQISLI